MFLFAALLVGAGCQKMEYIEQPVVTLLSVNGLRNANGQYRVPEGAAVEALISFTANKGLKEIRVFNMGTDDRGTRIDLDVSDRVTIELDESSDPAQAKIQLTADYEQFNDGVVSDNGIYRFDVYVVDALGAVAFSTFRLIP